MKRKIKVRKHKLGGQEVESDDDDVGGGEQPNTVEIGEVVVVEQQPVEVDVVGAATNEPGERESLSITTASNADDEGNPVGASSATAVQRQTQASLSRAPKAKATLHAILSSIRSGIRKIAPLLPNAARVCVRSGL